MKMTAVVLLAFVMASCASPRVIPDQRIPHRLAKPASVTVWTRKPDGSMSMQRMDIPEGWWVAGPLVVGE